MSRRLFQKSRKELKAGDSVMISEYNIHARDAAHKRMAEEGKIPLIYKMLLYIMPDQLRQEKDR